MPDEFKLPPAPAPESLISTEQAQAFSANTQTITRPGGGGTTLASHSYLVDTAANCLVAALGVKSAIITREDPYRPERILILRPDKQNYEGLEECDEVRRNFGEVRQAIDKYGVEGLPHYLPPTRTRTQNAFEAAYYMFDPNPANKEAAECRKKLQDSAKVLGLEELGKSAKRWARDVTAGGTHPFPPKG